MIFGDHVLELLIEVFTVSAHASIAEGLGIVFVGLGVFRLMDVNIVTAWSIDLEKVLKRLMITFMGPRDSRSLFGIIFSSDRADTAASGNS